MAKTTKNSNKDVIINHTVLVQNNRQSLDIGLFKNALQSAESVTNPNRSKLYDIYTNIKLDAHLMAVIQKRKLPILNSKLQLNTKNEAMKETIEKYTNTTEFKHFLSLCLDKIYWGHSLVEVIPRDTNVLAFDYVLIPRKNVRVDKKIVVKNPMDTDGIRYDTNEYNLIEVGDKEDLGLLCNAAPLIIYKRNGFGDFAQYVEIFGQPIREGIYNGYDEQSKEALKRDMEESGSSAIWIHSEDTQMKFVEANNKNGSSDVYKTLIQLCNAEVSKLILGNTLTTEVGDSGGNRALGEVMQEAEDQFVESDKSMVLNILNTQFVAIMQKFGVAIDGDFAFVEKINLKERIELDMKINSVAPIEPKYFEDTYGVPLKAEVTPEPTDSVKKDKKKKDKEKKSLVFKALSSFFS